MERTSRPDLHDVAWRKSSYSNQEGGNCVEVADGVPGVVPVRDSKDPHGPMVTFVSGSWATFIRSVKADRQGSGSRI